MEFHNGVAWVYYIYFFFSDLPTETHVEESSGDTATITESNEILQS